MSSSSTLGVTASTFMALDTQMATIASNLALSRVTGANAFVANFEVAAVENLRSAGAFASESDGNYSVGTNIVKGIKLAGLYPLISQGSQEQTDNPFDVMINGPGYAVVNTANGGKAYTRDLRLIRSTVLKKGPYELDPGIVIPIEASEITLSTNGEWQAILPGQTTPTILGQMTLVRFKNEHALRPTKDNLFLETGEDGSGPAIPGIAGTDGYGEFVQFALEKSTVNPTDQLIQLIEVSKIYGYVTKVIEREDEKEKQITRAA
jgi:flagellar basal-body rod protein FlgG